MATSSNIDLSNWNKRVFIIFYTLWLLMQDQEMWVMWSDLGGRISGWWGGSGNVDDNMRLSKHTDVFNRWIFLHSWANGIPQGGFYRKIWMCSRQVYNINVALTTRYKFWNSVYEKGWSCRRQLRQVTRGCDAGRDDRQVAHFLPESSHHNRPSEPFQVWDGLIKTALIDKVRS